MSILLYRYYHRFLSSAGSQPDGFLLTTLSQTEKKQSYFISIHFFSISYQGNHVVHLTVENCLLNQKIHVCKESRFMPGQEHTTLFSLRQIPQQDEVLSLLHDSWESYKDGITPSNCVLPSYVQHSYHASFTTALNRKFLCFAHGPSLSAFKTRNFTYLSRSS